MNYLDCKRNITVQNGEVSPMKIETHLVYSESKDIKKVNKQNRNSLFFKSL